MTETQYEYPTTARRAFVNLAEAVRTIDEPKAVRRMLEALAGLHVDEELRSALVSVYMDKQGEDRHVLAEHLAAVLEGQEKFHVARFIHHAKSDSTADDDGEGGKWSYNRTNPDDAMKTTIEGGDETVTL